MLYYFCDDDIISKEHESLNTQFDESDTIEGMEILDFQVTPDVLYNAGGGVGFNIDLMPSSISLSDLADQVNKTFPRYHYIWLPDIGEFFRYTRSSYSHIPENDRYLGCVFDTEIIEKHLFEPMIFSSVDKSVKWIKNMNNTIPPFYHHQQRLRDLDLKSHIMSTTNLIVSIDRSSFPFTRYSDYLFTSKEDGVILTFRSFEDTINKDPKDVVRIKCSTPSAVKALSQEVRILGLTMIIG